MRPKSKAGAGVCAGLALIVTLLAPRAMAQEMTFSPGQTVTVDLTFHGKDANQISTVIVNVNMSGPVQPGQSGFRTEQTQEAKKVGNTFRVSFAVQDNDATGTYVINQIRAVINQSAPIELLYLRNEFEAPTFKINNPRTIEKPKVKVNVH